MTPLWRLQNRTSPRYQFVTSIWAADVWRKVEPDETHYNWGVVLSNDDADQYWFDDADTFFRVSQDRWLGHFPEDFEDQLRALVALLN